jgi:4-hydroxyphenylpyruvate dioxygenase
MKESIGLGGLVALHRFVRRVDDDRALLSGLLDFEEVAASGPALEAHTGQRSLVFRAGECLIVSTEPLRADSQADRFLRRHPEGVGALTLAVDDVAHAFAVLDRAGGTPVRDVQWWPEAEGEVGTFSLATPLDDVLFHFVGRRPGAPALPGFLWHRTPQGGKNRFGILSLDHITANFLTMAPAILWYEHVLGLEQCWEIAFHTSDARPGDQSSGLRSVVLWDPRSGLKFASNEPLRPNFEISQISVFCDEHRGSGVQHVALVVADIVGAVTALRARGARFTRTPSAYFDHLPARLERSGIHRIQEDLDVLREHEILVDGNSPQSYLLQIFLEDGARASGHPEKGPFFFELIQRRGDDGFGAGNFRALFESIAVAQQGGLQ